MIKNTVKNNKFNFKCDASIKSAASSKLRSILDQMRSLQSQVSLNNILNKIIYVTYLNFFCFSYKKCVDFIHRKTLRWLKNTQKETNV